MQPISKYNENLHKGPSTSSEFNTLRNEIHHDLVSLFNLANEHDQVIKENMDILIWENFFLQNRLHKLESLVEKIKADMFYKEQGRTQQKLIKSFYSVEDILPGSPALVDTVHGLVTMPASDRISKLTYTTSDQRVHVPRSLEVTAMESTNVSPIVDGVREYYRVDDPNVNRAFDRNENSFWIRKTSFPEEQNVTEVYGILHIKLPLDMINNVYANTLTIHPYPEYSMTILDIQYKGYGTQWHRLPNYPVENEGESNESPIPIKDSGKLLFSFPNTEITEVQILFSQPYWFSKEENREFVYGFQEITIENHVYNQDQTEFVTEFSLQGTGRSFSRIEKPVCIPVAGTPKDIDHLIEHKLYYSKDLSYEFPFGSEILAPVEKVYIKTTIRREADIIPHIKQLQLTYNYKNLGE